MSQINKSFDELWYFNYSGSFPFYNETSELPVGRSVLIGCTLGLIVVCAILGNILVVASVCTNKRLRTITNFYVVSLALADLCVASLVMPLGIAVEITGRWLFGTVVCEMWVSCDVMLCTASILNLCCISLDRYFAITKPLEYSTRRSKRLALMMIAVVWVAAVVITCPPIFGWQEEGRYEDDDNCHLIKDPGYIIYSSLGSFYLPLLVMIFVYMRIFRVASQREKRLKPYRRSFRRPRSRNRRPDGLESIRLTEARDSEDTEDKSVERQLLPVENGGPRPPKQRQCVGVRHLQEGLVINSALAMQQIVRAHRNSLRHNSLHSEQHHHHQIHHHHHHHPQQQQQHGRLRSSPTHHHPQHHQELTAALSLSPPQSRKPAQNNNVSHQTHKDFLQRKDERCRERAALLREHKAAKTLAVVVGGFVFCWLPFFLMYIIEPFCESCNMLPVMVSFFTWLGYFNSVLNPFIYAFYNKDFRHSFWMLTFGRCCKTPEPTRL